MKHLVTRACVAALVGASMLASAAIAQSRPPIDPDKARVIEFWTKERRAAAIPRDLVIDERGLGYLKHPSGYLQPYGHDKPAVTRGSDPVPSPFGKPSGGGGSTSGDTTPPKIENMVPGGANVTIGSSATFSAKVTDDSGVKSVNVLVRKGSSREQSFAAAKSASDDIWSVGLQGFSDGSWSWRIKATDRANVTGYSDSVAFTVNTSSATGGGGGSCALTTGTVTNSRWCLGGVVQTAAGRIYFEMPYNGAWGGFVCSGTVAQDGVNDRSTILTAAHCVYDDVNKAFARNVMFIPNQDGTSGTGTDLNCGNDPIGCWTASFGVVDHNWTTRTFPDNIPWDYAFYVVNDTGAHSNGLTSSLDSLEKAAGSMAINFNSPSTAGSDGYTHGLGYSYANDPYFMFCAQGLSTKSSDNWWLGDCGLSGGASGGPWVQPMGSDGGGPIISVNSWGYVDRRGNPLPGMAGPKLSGTSASCVFGGATATTFNSISSEVRGTAVTCP